MGCCLSQSRTLDVVHITKVQKYSSRMMIDETIQSHIRRCANLDIVPRLPVSQVTVFCHGGYELQLKTSDSIYTVEKIIEKYHLPRVCVIRVCYE